MPELMQQDIVWVRFPFSSMEDAKFRPAVVVSNNTYNRKNSDVIVCAITSNLEPKDYSIVIDNSNLDSGKLPIKSKIRADKISLMEKKIIDKPFAKLNIKTFEMLSKEIFRLVKK